MYNKKEHVIQLLIAHGASLVLSDSAGNTPLHLAALRSSKDIVMCLLEKGANIYSVNYS